MGIPTAEEYEKAKSNIKHIKTLIRYEQETIDGLLDKIIQCRQTITRYEGVIRSNQNVIDAYELYKELTKEK